MSDAQPVLPAKIDRRRGRFLYRVTVWDYLGLPWSREPVRHVQTNRPLHEYVEAFVDDMTWRDRQLQPTPRMQHGRVRVELIEDPDIYLDRRW